MISKLSFLILIIGAGLNGCRHMPYETYRKQNIKQLELIDQKEREILALVNTNKGIIERYNLELELLLLDDQIEDRYYLKKNSLAQKEEYIKDLDEVIEILSKRKNILEKENSGFRERYSEYLKMDINDDKLKYLPKSEVKEMRKKMRERLSHYLERKPANKEFNPFPTLQKEKQQKSSDDDKK